MNFPVEKLLETIKKNREKHIAEYQESENDYKKLLKVKLHEKLKALDNGKVPDAYISLSPPRKHVNEYDQLISMLEFTTDKNITLDRRAFSCYVLDKWDWKESFTNTSDSYKAALSSY